jgi:hypothetical protein
MLKASKNMGGTAHASPRAVAVYGYTKLSSAVALHHFVNSITSMFRLANNHGPTTSTIMEREDKKATYKFHYVPTETDKTQANPRTDLNFMACG